MEETYDMWRFTVEFFWWHFLGTREAGGSPEKDPVMVLWCHFLRLNCLIDNYFLVGRALNKYVYMVYSISIHLLYIHMHLYIFFGHAYAVYFLFKEVKSNDFDFESEPRSSDSGGVLISFPLNFKARSFQSCEPKGPDEFHWINPCANAYAAAPPHHCQWQPGAVTFFFLRKILRVCSRKLGNGWDQWVITYL